MSISSTDRVAGPYAGNGVATAFPFEFKVFQRSDVLVAFVSAAGAESVLVLDSDYTVALNADQDVEPGGTVTLSAPLVTGETLTVTSQVPATQPVVLTNLGAFLPAVINSALDRLTILIQQCLGLFSRALALPASETGGDASIPGAAERAGKFLAFDALGRPTVALPVVDSAADVRLDLASPASGKGAEMVATAVHTFNKLSEALNAIDWAAQQSGALNVLRYIPPSEWSAIKAGTSTYDCTAAIQSGLNAVGSVGGGAVFFPKGAYVFSSITVPAKVRLIGDGLDVTYLKTSTTGAAITLIASVSHGCSVEQLTLQQTGTVQGKGIAGTDVYWFNTKFVRVTGFVDNLYFSKAIYHTHKRLFSENSTNGVNYYGSVGTWNTDWFNNVLTFDTCRFSSCTAAGVAIKGCEVVFINPDFSGNATGLRVYGDASGGRAHGVYVISPYVESTDIGFGFTHAYVTLDGGFIQGGPSAGAAAYTSIIDADESIVRWNGKMRDQDYFDYGWRLTNNSELLCQSNFSGSMKAANIVDSTSFAGFTFQETFNATLTGCTTTPTVVGRYSVSNGQVVISIPANVATSNSTSCTVTGLPGGAWPAREQITTGSYFNDGIEVTGTLRVTTGGVIVLSNGAYGTAFTSSGLKGHRGLTISYMLS